MDQAVTSQAVSAQGVVETLTALLGVALLVALLTRRLRFPYTLALALVGLALGLTRLLPPVELQPAVVLFIFLPVLLFEGAWNIEMPALLANWLIILLLAAPGLLVAVGIAALALHFGAGFSVLDALLLSAIISPTDPIAVIALLRQLGLSSRLSVIIEGESLFNDGIGAVTFTVTLSVLLTVIQSGSAPAAGQAGVIALQSAWLLLGGPLLGLALGFLVSRALRHIEDRLIETAATFITAYGVYLIADLMHTSGLLAVVMAGLMVGSYGRRVGISDFAREPVENVWDFASYVVTSLLFLLLGLKIGASLTLKSIAPTLWAALGVFVARAVIVYGVLLPYNGIARWYRQRHAHARARGRPIPLPGSWRPLIVLSGLRGALSIALALSLPTALPNRDLMSSVVYGVVLITLIGQGIGLRALLPHWPNLHDGPDGQVSQHVERETESTGTSSQPSSQT
ncbi:MAG TPA: sodium:proton antiporter [Ktedonobacterales bacterium]|nr:sodium:proton antiporter [Ktedonobacterales bacterium]